MTWLRTAASWLKVNLGIESRPYVFGESFGLPWWRSVAYEDHVDQRMTIAPIGVHKLIGWGRRLMWIARRPVRASCRGDWGRWFTYPVNEDYICRKCKRCGVVQVIDPDMFQELIEQYEPGSWGQQAPRSYVVLWLERNPGYGDDVIREFAVTVP